MTYKTGLMVAAAFIAGIYVLFSIATRPPEGASHQVYVDGVVITMDANNTVAEAMSVRDGRIEAVGSSEAILALVNEGTEVTQLRGRTLMPGFVDAHGHFPGSGQTAFSVDLSSPPVGEITNIDALIEKLSAFGETRPDGWLTGWGYDDTLLAEGRHPTRDDLDRISTTRPISITHVSGHLVVVNSAALAALGIDATTPDPEGGHIQRDPNSPDGLRPLGVLEETAAREVMMHTFDIGIMDAVRMATSAGREYVEHGVTLASAGGMPMSAAKALGPLSRFNLIPVRVALFPLLEEVEASVASGEFRPESLAAGRVTAPRVKIIADGSIQGFTGYLKDPYYVAYRGDPTYRGYPSVARDTLIRQVTALYEKRIQVAIHCNGDASIDDGLDAIEAASKAHPWPEARPLIIHAQMARIDQIDRMVALNTTPSFFTAHTYYWGDRHAAIFMGPERAANMSPSAWAVAAGLRFSSHMDTPVTPMLPLQAVWSQVYRESKSGAIIGPEQRIDPMTALRAVTIDAAWQVFLDNELGSLEPGKLADLIILSGNPLEVEDMRELIVERTVVEGATVYSRR